MKGTRIKTLWSINGRAPDSRDVWDDTGLGLKVGRVDIPGSLMVNTEGYTSVLYRRTMSTGDVADYGSIMEALTVYGTQPVVETIPGSGVMTFFVSDTESSYPGIFKIDVVKEWDSSDPEPEPISINDLSDISGRGLGLVKHPEAFGIGGYASRINWDDAAKRGLSMFISDARGAPGSTGLNVMGVSVAHTAGYTFQIGGRNGQIWTRFQEAGELGKWEPLGGSAFNPKPLEDKIAALEKRIAALEAAAK